MSRDNIYFRQFLSGQDFAKDNPVAVQMVNFVYAIGDLNTKECFLVDPTYSVDDLLSCIEKDSMNLKGILLTHYHADHAGGNLFGHQIEGSRELLDKVTVPVYCNKDEKEWLTKGSGLDADDLIQRDSGDIVTVGDVEIKLIATPGHTPGSQCFLVDNLLVAGDTLFLDGCGRTDLPGSDPEKMYDSLINRLSKLDDSTVVYPGHFYSQEPFDNLGEVKVYNPVLKPRSPREWLAIFG